MATKRVHKMARELGITSKELIEHLNKLGYEVKSHANSVEEEAAQKVIELLKEHSMKEEIEQAKAAEAEKRKRAIEEQKREQARKERESKTIQLPGKISVRELAEKLKVKRTDLVKTLMNLGIMSVHQKIDFDTASIIAEDYGFYVKAEPEQSEEKVIEEDKGKLPSRPPIVTVMGHVDHGKTSLLDAIRETRVIDTESGGITQHIGAYQVSLKNGRKITFIDTPGHEAFTAMRAHGAKVTDIVVLVVAADEGVKNQTVEAIDHAIAAEVPIIVALNKIDKDNANVDRVKQELITQGLVPEEFGGETICVEVSAKEKTNLDELLEMILLTADILELKCQPNQAATGVIIEARLDRSRGPTATVLVQNGTLHRHDSVVIGCSYGRIRNMIGEDGKSRESAGPGTPVEIFGLSEVPNVGSKLFAVKSEKQARAIAESRKRKLKESQSTRRQQVNLKDLAALTKKGEIVNLNFIIKADVKGSVTALRDSLVALSEENIRINIIHGGVGNITESDIMLASASQAMILGFQVKPTAAIMKIAEDEGVEVKIYDVIYPLIDDVKAMVKGSRKPQYVEEIMGKTEIRQIFKISNLGVIAGSFVKEGVLHRDHFVRVIRNGKVTHNGRIVSLRRFKEDIEEVKAGLECGVGLYKYNDLRAGDILESYRLKEVELK